MCAGDVAYRRRLLERWGYACVVCGYGFVDLASVTKEHIIPRAAEARLKAELPPMELGASHYRCNIIRGRLSLVRAAAAVEARRVAMGTSRFFEWINEHVPNRVVPHEALLPPRPQRFLDLPEHLPGVP